MIDVQPDDRRALLHSALQAIDELQSELDAVGAAAREPIAIVGMSCRFPGGASSPEAFWDLLHAGRDVVSEYPAERRALVEASGADLSALDDGTRWYGGFLDQIDGFDPQFFGISPREAATMDPQQRMVLEVSWEALERAGIAPDSLVGSATGVFVGITTNDYIQLGKLAGPDSLDVYSATGGALNAAAGRVAYTLGLQGPCMAIDTACSSSLVAVHEACHSLRAGESDLALAGGVNLLLLPEAFVCFERWGMMAPDGRCKTFDASADGFVRGEGCGVVVLKRLSDAVEAGDPILAVVRGSAVNQDGRSSGLTVPNGLAQQAVLTRALANAGVEPADIQYFEAHGTGTTLGDPIEIEAIGAVLGRGRGGAPLTIGSVKTNIGHLESAAGIAGLIKVVLSMQHAEIPPHLHFEARSPQIPWPAFPIVVPTSPTPWPAEGARRLAGVSGFGFSGTNAHLVVESAPIRTRTSDDRPGRVVTLSARTDAGLAAVAADLGRWIESTPDASLADISATANSGRAVLPHRLAVVASSPGELAVRLAGAARTITEGGGQEPDGVTSGQARRPRLAFVFTGQGSQHVGMGRELYEHEPVFRAAFDRCAAVIDPTLPRPLRHVVFAEPGSVDAALIDTTAFTQPALFAVEMALSELWRSWGIEPDAVLGHSVGELVAATVAGVFSVEDAALLVAARGRLMQALPAGGAMAAVFAPAAEVVAAIARRGDGQALAIAAINGPAHTVVSGAGAAVAVVTAELAASGVRVEQLSVSHAFHSPLMAAMLDEFRHVVAAVQMHPPQRRIVSNVTGEVAGPEIATAEYWIRHVMAPVRFADGMRALRGAGIDTFVEVGPHPVLTAMGQECLQGETCTWVPTLRRRRDAVSQVLLAAGRLFVVGASIDWPSVRADDGRTAMPTTVFQRQRCWIEPAPARRRQSRRDHPLLGEAVAAPLFRSTIHTAMVETTSPAWLDHHRLAGTAVFPGTAYVECVLAAADVGDGSFVSISLTEALVLPDSGAVTLQTVVTDGDERREVQVLSIHGGGPAHTVHARATVAVDVAPAPAPAPVDVGALLSVCADEIDVAEYYAHLDRIGLNYGPSFRGLTRLRRRAGEAVGRVELPSTVGDGARSKLHPALFDACFHVLGVAIAVPDAEGSDEMYVPVAIEGLRLHSPGATAAWCHVTLLDGAAVDADTGSRPSYQAAIEVVDEDGQPIATVERLEVRRTPRSMWAQVSGAASDPVYRVEWRGEPRPEDADRPRAWLVVGEPGGMAAQVQAALGATGAPCTVCAGGAGPASVRDALLPLVAAGAVIGVVDLSGADPTVETDVRTALGGALDVTQVLADHVPADADVRLWLVTSAGQSVDGEAAQPIAASRWGFGRVVASELPHLSCTCIDVDRDADSCVDDLVAELLHPGADAQIAIRGRHRTVARLRRTDTVDRLVPPGPCRLVLGDRGALDAIGYVPSSRRAPGPGEVEVEVRATGLNFRDVLNVLGMMPGDPGMPGLEFAGVVAAVGADVIHLAVGDPVLGIAPHAFDSYVVTDAALVVAKPPSLTFAEAATIPIAYLTAAHGLQHLARVQPGERVLVHAAAGGVGMAALHIAQRMGAEVFATAGSPAKRRVLERLGVRHVYSSRTLDFADLILADTGGEGVDVVLNSLADEFIERSFAVLGARGRFLEIGKRGIWTDAQASSARPDGEYHPYDLADLLDDGRGIRDLLQSTVDAIAAGELPALPMRAFALAETEHAFRFMAQARHVGKVVVVHPRTAAAVCADGSYLVTGGLGGLGLAVAGWLAGAGAGTIVLAGRTAPSSEAQEVVDALRAGGADVRVVRADVADAAGVDAMVAAAHAVLPLRGVFHTAGVNDDGAIGQQTWPRFETVLAAKLTGAELLDAATERLDLDHFVLFSSAAAVLGAPGQSNYAAANAAMDALAIRRRAAGLPALSIGWGAWAGAGMAARLDERVRRRNAERGVDEMDPSTAIGWLVRLLGHGRAHVVVLQADWRRLAGSSGVAPPFLQEVVSGTVVAAPPASSGRLLSELREMELTERAVALHAAVAAQVVAVLGLDPLEPLDSEQGLSDLGMDSLMAVELSNRLSSLLVRSVASTVPFEHPTANELAAHMIELLGGDVDFEGPAPPPPAAATSEHDAIFDLAADDVADALLRELDDAGY